MAAPSRHVAVCIHAPLAQHTWQCSAQSTRSTRSTRSTLSGLAPATLTAAVALSSACALRGRHLRRLRRSRERFWQTLDFRSWTTGVQDPKAPLPKVPLPCPDIRETEVREFEENGVVLLRGVIPEWVPYLKQVTLHQMEHPQVTAVLTSLRTFFSMDYVQAGLFLTNQGYLDFWYSSCIAQLVAKLKGSKEVRLIVDQLNVNPYLPPFTEPEKFHTDVGVISAVAEEKDVVRCWIPLQKAQRHGLGTLEFQLKDRRIRFEDVEEGDVVMFTPTIPHRVLFPPDGETYEQDRCVVIASLHASNGGPHPLEVPEFPRLFPERDESEVQARANERLYSNLDRYFDLWGKPTQLLDEWMQFITYREIGRAHV